MAPVSETTIRRAYLGAAQPGQRYAAQRDLVVGLGAQQPEPVGERGGLVGLAR